MAFPDFVSAAVKAIQDASGTQTDGDGQGVARDKGKALMPINDKLIVKVKGCHAIINKTVERLKIKSSRLPVTTLEESVPIFAGILFGILLLCLKVSNEEAALDEAEHTTEIEEFRHKLMNLKENATVRNGNHTDQQCKYGSTKEDVQSCRTFLNVYVAKRGIFRQRLIHLVKMKYRIMLLTCVMPL